MTARQIIETRLGRDLGPLATMPRDLLRALYRLALQLQKENQVKTRDEAIRDIADVLNAVCDAERFVGRPDDEYGALLNPVLDARTWEDHR